MKVINGGWDNSLTKEYVFKRATDWLDQYSDKGHDVTMGLSEYGHYYSEDANVVAVHYASMLGTFAQNKVEIFSPLGLELRLLGSDALLHPLWRNVEFTVCLDQRGEGIGLYHPQREQRCTIHRIDQSR